MILLSYKADFVGMLKLLYRIHKLFSYIRYLVTPKTNAEYIIYTFSAYNNEPSREHLKNWNKHRALNDIHEAIKVAEKLFLSGQYTRVEVKQRYLKKNNQATDKVFCAYDAEHFMPLFSTIVLLGTLVVSVAVGTFMYIAAT